MAIYSATRYPTIGAFGGSGDAAWTLPDNVEGVADGVVASVEMDEGLDSNQIRGGGYGFTVPTYGIIKGVKTGVKGMSFSGISGFASNGLRLHTASLYTSGATKSPADLWPSGLALMEWGDANDLWGLGAGLTPAIVNSAAFGPSVKVLVAAINLGDRFEVDSMPLTVWWEVPNPIAYTRCPPRIAIIGGGKSSR